MNKVFAFNYKNTDYFAFAGVSDAAVPKQGANVITKRFAFQDEETKKLLLQESVSPAKELNDIPVMRDAFISKSGEYFNLKGTLTIDGTIYDVVVTDAETVFTARNAEPSAKSVPIAHSSERVKYTHGENGIASLRLKLGGSKSQFGLQLGASQRHEPVRDVTEIIRMLTQDQLYQLYQELDKRFGRETVETPKPQVKAVEPTIPVEEACPAVPAENARSIEDEFLGSLKPEVAAVIQDIPYELIKECTVSTSKDIDSVSLGHEGVKYCKANNWQLCLDYYAIDNLVTMERYFYNRKTGAFTAVPMRVIQKWRRIISE